MNDKELKLLKQVPTYHYYVAYQFNGGFGGIEVYLIRPIRGWDDIKIITDIIRSKAKIKGAVVLNNWILL